MPTTVVCLVAAASVAGAQHTHPDAVSVEAGVSAAEAVGTTGGLTVAVELGLPREAYEAWDGDWDNPHFVFPGDATAAPPRVRLIDGGFRG